MIKSKTIVFVHGLFMNPTSWEPWITFFEAKGYQCFAPSFPFHSGKPSDLREKIDPALTKLTISDVVKMYVRFIEDLSEKPIVIGHSMGGFICQKLIEFDKALAGICIDSAAPAGINTFKWSFWKANFPVINPLKGNSAFVPSVEWFQYAFCNTMTREETMEEYQKFVVPEARSIPRSIPTDPYGKIDLKKAHNPLLFIAGEKDNIIPAALNKKNFNAYKDQNSIKHFKEFAGRSHYICGQKNWEEVANYICIWIDNLPFST